MGVGESNANAFFGIIARPILSTHAVTHDMKTTSICGLSLALAAVFATPPAGAQTQGGSAPAQGASAPAPATGAPAQAGGNYDAGRQKSSMCAGCHSIPGYKTAFPSVYSVPKIDGQHAVYIVSALRAYKSGERRHPSMRAIAASLSEQDMADLAAFYANGTAKSASR